MPAHAEPPGSVFYRLTEFLERLERLSTIESRKERSYARQDIETEARLAGYVPDVLHLLVSYRALPAAYQADFQAYVRSLGLQAPPPG